MQTDFAQPNANLLPDDLVRSIVSAVAPDVAVDEVAISHTDVHSNDLAVARVPDGRALVIKRGRYEWSGQRLAVSRRASALLRAGGIVAPAPLELPEKLRGQAIEVYWRIDLPILDELWPSLDEVQRRAALRSFGELARRVHAIVPAHFGPLNRSGAPGPLAAMLEADLSGRLLPAAYGEWPQGAAVIERLLEQIPELAPRLSGRRPALVHNDLHMGNVLCEVDGNSVRCVGLLDLEAAAAGVPESDFAMMQVLHGPLFGRHLDGDWYQDVQRGYGRELDAWVLGFFRVLHRLNLGFYSALVGHDWHAEQVALEAEREVAALRGKPRLLVQLAG